MVRVSFPSTVRRAKIDAHRLPTSEEPLRLPRKRPYQELQPAAEREPASDCEGTRISDEGGQPSRCPNRLRRISATCIRFLQGAKMRRPGARRETAARPRELCDRTLRRLPSRHDAYSRVDANGVAKGSHFVRHVPEHSHPRICPSSRFQAL